MPSLPTVGGDTGAWGTILNAWLLTAHNADGTLKDVIRGTSYPEGTVTAPVGTIYIRSDGGYASTLYVKESGAGNTGWVAYPSSLLQTNVQGGTAYTLVSGDSAKVVEMTNAAANVITVPPNSTTPYPIGVVIEIHQYGAGQTSIAAGAGVTIRAPDGLKLSSQYASASLRKRATDEWILSGDLVA